MQAYTGCTLIYIDRAIEYELEDAARYFFSVIIRLFTRVFTLLRDGKFLREQRRYKFGLSRMVTRAINSAGES